MSAPSMSTNKDLMIITNNLPAARGLIAHVLVRTGPRDTIDTGFTIVVGSIALQISSIDQTMPAECHL